MQPETLTAVARICTTLEDYTAIFAMEHELRVPVGVAEY